MNKIKVGAIIMASGVVVALSPLAMAFFATTPGHNMWSEGDSQSGGSYLWGMLMTLPLGLLIGLVGLVFIILGTIKPVKQGEEFVPTPKGNGKIAGISLIVLGSLFIIFWIPLAYSVIGGTMILAGGVVLWLGIRLLLKARE